MLILKCKCGGDRFSIHHAEAIVRCEKCHVKHKFDFQEKVWVEWHPFHEAAKAFVRMCEETIQSAEEKVQSIGEWMKERGIQKYRKPHNEVTTKLPNNITTYQPEKVAIKFSPELLFGNIKMRHEFALKEKWKNEIKAIQENKAVWFGANVHVGTIRGKHIGKTLHRDLKRLGIDSELVFVDDGVWVKPVQGKIEGCN